MSRRHIVTAWNPATLDKMALNACHALVQFNCRLIPTHERRIFDPVTGGIAPWFPNIKDDTEYNKALDEFNVPRYYLDCQLYQRSADVFLGVPFNIASYALLTHILCKICNMVPGDFVHTFGDVHIYDNHVDAVKEQLTREPYPLPQLEFNNQFQDWDLGDINEWVPEGFILKDYQHHPAIKAELSTGLKK